MVLFLSRVGLDPSLEAKVSESSGLVFLDFLSDDGSVGDL